MKTICIFVIVLLAVAATKGFTLDEVIKLESHSPDLTANKSCTQDCCKSLPNRPPMIYNYYQNTGRFRGGQGDYKVDIHGYSGQGKGYLNPDAQCISNTGPLPASTYKITWCKNMMHETIQRPCAFYLQPQKKAQMCGRGDFFIHGCDCCTPGDDTNPPSAGCSAGCVVISYINRKKLRIGDTILVHHYEPKALPNIFQQSFRRNSWEEETYKRNE